MDPLTILKVGALPKVELSVLQRILLEKKGAHK